jgi:transmembrane sensor
MDYSNFEIEDLASDDSFIRWVIYKDPAATKFWADYRSKHPESSEKIEQACALLLTLHREEETSHERDQIHKTWLKIERRISSEPSKSLFPFLRIAASLSLFLVLAAIWFVVSNGSFADRPVTRIAQLFDTDLVEQVNKTGAMIKMVLSDGTVVSLEDNSSLRYYNDYRGKTYRKVYLTGEAFFDVAKNTQQPFLVYANEVVTKVLGTSFRVKAYDDGKDVIVSVKEGKVSVYSESWSGAKKNTSDPERNGVVLMQNQQVLYKRTDDSFNKTLIESPAIVKELPAAPTFDFNNAPVKEVFDVLSEAYGVEMIYNEEVLENCYLTAPLGDEPLFEKLRIVCRTIGASYELIDAKVVISSTGCGEPEDK